MKLLLPLASFAAVIGMAVPAHADSTDDSFIAALKAAGITVTSYGAMQSSLSAQIGQAVGASGRG